MKNKISIDEMVRQNVAKGEEPHNLSAWANMERMLDGKNPYQKEDDRKKRPWLLLLFGLLIGSTAIVGGYNYFSGGNNTTQAAVAKSPSNAQDDNNSNTNNEPLTALNHEAGTQQEISNSDTDAQSFAEENNSNQLYASSEPIVASTTPKSINPNNTTRQKINDSKFTNSTKEVINSLPNTNHVPEKATNYLIASSSKNQDVDAISQNKKSELSEDMRKKELAITTELENTEPTLVETYKKKTKVMELNHKIKKDAYGNRKYVVDTNSYEIVQEKERIIINPRFIELTKAQEEAAERRTALASNNNMASPKTVPPLARKTAPNAEPASVGLQANANNAKKKGGFFSLFKSAAQKINQKGINMAHTPLPIYSGMFVGVNAAFNTPHNFGGFHAGFLAMTPLSRIFTLRTEARFIHKNNSGYTITDNRHDIVSNTIDTSSVFKSKVYNYQIDSVARSYNLQNFYTLQIPVLLSANIKKFTAYGGLNFNYGFRMNVNSSQRSNPMSASDTVQNGQAYTPRVSSDMKFTTADFGSRIGLGYTVGGSYNVNPSLFLDFRVSSPIWDNTKGAAKQDISNVFFKIPSFQLSLGYRFRKYKPDN